MTTWNRRMASLSRGCIAVGAICIGLWAMPALAEECSNPNALGTSRILAIDPSKQPRVGAVAALPLADHELVITFDDGPIPPSTADVLDELAAECVRATFFIVGENANDSPHLIRRALAEGHSIGSHTQTHPHLSGLKLAAAKAEIDKGIASTQAALGPDHPIAPFFRAPYLDTTSATNEYLRSLGVVSFGIDFDAQDWTEISPEQVMDNALKGIEAKKKGVLLLHDIQARTAAALPNLLKELKKRGYHIVHLVPAEPQGPSGQVAGQGSQVNKKVP